MHGIVDVLHFFPRLLLMMMVLVVVMLKLLAVVLVTMRRGDDVVRQQVVVSKEQIDYADDEKECQDIGRSAEPLANVSL